MVQSCGVFTTEERACAWSHATFSRPWRHSNGTLQEPVGFVSPNFQVEVLIVRSNKSLWICLAIGIGIVYGYRVWSAADLRRRLVESASWSEGSFYAVSLEAKEWPGAWRGDHGAGVAIQEAAEKGWLGAFGLAGFVSDGKEGLWRSACNVIEKGTIERSYHAARDLASIENPMPRWVMDRVWEYAMKVAEASDDEDRREIAKFALDGVANTSEGKRFLLEKVVGAGESGRAALSKLGIGKPDVRWSK